MLYKRVWIQSVPYKGRGVFAQEDIKKGEVIEDAPVIIILKDQKGHLKKTQLFNYFFQWGEDMGEAAVALGFGSLYNHSYHPNAEYQKDFPGKVIDFVAIKDIKKGEEVTVNYNGHSSDQTRIWFEVKE